MTLPMSRSLRILAPLALLALDACADRESLAPEPGQPSFYRSLAASGAHVDAVAAREMISLYRRNNSLSSLEIDETLRQAAQAQADAMAAADSLDHNVRGTLDRRLAARGMKSARGGECLGRLSHARRSFFRLAAVAAA
jgi:uncharacterized protein YkwD